MQITEIAHGLEFRISELKQDNTDHKTTTLEHAVDVILQSDDALLTSLQKLGWELSEPDPEEAKSTDKLRETCLRQVLLSSCASIPCSVLILGENCLTFGI